MTFDGIEIIVFGLIWIPFTFSFGYWLSQKGHVFIESIFGKSDQKSSAISFLLNIGWYFTCIGLLLFNMGVDVRIESSKELIQTVCTRLGTCVVLVGFLHSFNILSISLLHNRKGTV